VIELTDEFLFDKIAGVLSDVGIIIDDPSTYKRICSRNDEEVEKGISAFLVAFWRAFEKESYLPSLLNFLKDSQRFLHEQSESYRDHYRHSISLFALGVYLGKNLLPYDDVLNVQWDKRHWILSWGVAAQFHDLAYLFQRMRQFLPLDIGSVRVTDEAATSYWNRFLHSRDDWGKCLAITRKLERLDHGATSAIWVMDEIWRRSGYDRPGQEDRFKDWIFPAGEAMAIHTLDPSDEIQLSKSPLAHLLVLCDELQEWGRDMGCDENHLLGPSRENVVKMEEKVRDRLIAEIGFPVKDSLSKLAEEKKKNLRRLHGLEGRITIWNTLNEKEAKEPIDLVA
jgi:hypothetical protein